MPIYEYHCETCGTYQRIQRTVSRLDKCKTCGSPSKPVISAHAKTPEAWKV